MTLAQQFFWPRIERFSATSDVGALGGRDVQYNLRPGGKRARETAGMVKR
jgi:hypothetical protein